MRFDQPFQGNRRAVRRCFTFLLVFGLLAAWPAGSWGASGPAIGRALNGVLPGCTPLLDDVVIPGVTYDADPDEVPLNRKVSISPPLFEAEQPLEAGDRFVCLVKIRSRYDRRATFELRSVGIVGSHSGRTTAEFLDADDPDAAATAADWITPVVDHVSLDPRGVALVPVVVTVPQDPPVGSAYGALDVVATSAAAGPGDTNLGIETHVLASFLLAVGGEGAPKLVLKDAHAPKLRWNRDPWTLRAKLDNEGTLHATPRGRVRIRSLFGNVVNELRVADLPLLPGGRTRVVRTWDDVPWFGIYRWDLRVRDARAEGDAIRYARADGWFVALPPWWVLAISAAIIVIALLGRRLRRDEPADDGMWGDDDQDLDGNNGS
jgi:hypothetical protein